MEGSIHLDWGKNYAELEGSPEVAEHKYRAGRPSLKDINRHVTNPASDKVTGSAKVSWDGQWTATMLTVTVRRESELDSSYKSPENTAFHSRTVDIMSHMKSSNPESTSAAPSCQIIRYLRYSWWDKLQHMAQMKNLHFSSRVHTSFLDNALRHHIELLPADRSAAGGLPFGRQRISTPPGRGWRGCEHSCC